MSLTETEAEETTSQGEAPSGGAFSPVVEPVLNTPYEITRWHWQISDENRALPIRNQGRRPSIGMLPVPEESGSGDSQQVLELNPEDLNETVNGIRAEVATWRQDGRYEGATEVSKRLLKYWKKETRQPRLFFAQIEAMETLIWLTEVAPTGGETAQLLLAEVQEASRLNNDGLERFAIKMATGTGKTVVMGMVITWHAVNAFEASDLPAEQRSRYLTSFVAITPGHTVRERLEVLKPSPRPGTRSVYDEMDLVPPADRPALRQVQIQIVNFQKFQQQDRLDATGDAKKLIRRGDTSKDLEERSAMLRRVLRGMSGIAEGAPAKQIGVLNDEAHHCYLPEEGVRTGEDKDEDKAAALWFSAIKSLQNEGWLGAVYDFSATPMFIQTTDRKKSLMFPWVVSDFPLMDAIEAGLVKIPRVPVDSNAPSGNVEWRNLYKHVGVKKLVDNKMPLKLRTAIDALYDDYKSKFEQWHEWNHQTPPVFIVVANNIANAGAFYRYLAGSRQQPRTKKAKENGEWTSKASQFDLFTNYTDHGSFAPGLNTLLVHSKLEGDDTVGKNTVLGTVLADQAEQLKLRIAELEAQGIDTTTYEGLSDKELVRRALNTVGRQGELGGQIRCVVSVSMLTEGWDTRTVTHVLGYRAFGTQLLCEQVTGRALRRTSYENFDDQGRLQHVFAEVLGIPFDFMPVGGKQPPDLPQPPKYNVFTLPGRQSLRIEFPRLNGYLVEPSGIGIKFDPEKVVRFNSEHFGATKAELAGVAGEDKTLEVPEPDEVRHQAIVTKISAVIADKLTDRFVSEGGGDGDGGAGSDASGGLADGEVTDFRFALPRLRQLFCEAVPVVSQWLEHSQVEIAPEHWNSMLNDAVVEEAAKQIVAACVPDLARSSTAKRIGVFDEQAIGSTEGIDFETTLPDRYPALNVKQTETKRSELNVAACHSGWEAKVARWLDRHDQVEAWVRNFRLGWTVPYEFEGEWSEYEPDFVVRLKPDGAADGKAGGPAEDSAGDKPVYLIIEVKGLPDDRSEAKAEYVKRWWIPAVRNSPQVPVRLRHRWAFAELSDGRTLKQDLDRAIDAAIASAADGSTGTAINNQ